MATRFLSMKKRNDFLNIRNSGQTVKTIFLIINYKRNTSEITKKNFRLGLTVSKKIGNAVKRNYVKRILRSLYIKQSMNIPKEFDYEVIPKKNIINCKFKELEQDLKNSINRIK